MLLTLTFLERFEIADRAAGPLFALRQWDYNDAVFITLRMEDMTAQPKATVLPILEAYCSDRSVLLPLNSDMMFDNFSGGRMVGDVDIHSHYRSGSVDSWRTELPS